MDGSCQCPDGYTGEYCEISKCDSVNCINGGICNDGTCICPDGFIGPNCETPVVDSNDGPIDFDELFSHDYSYDIPRYVDFIVTQGSYYDEQVQVFTDGLSRLGIDNKLAALGRVLFYDPSLSSSNTISCASCHQQEFGFSDIHQFSTGVNGSLSSRNSPGLANSIFYPTLRGYAWDQANGKLTDQFAAAITNRLEMNMSLLVLKNKLAHYDYYPPIFETVYGDSEITSDRILDALKHFVCAMASFDSKYDQGRSLLTSNENGFISSNPALTAEENTGKALFIQHGCESCHIAEIFRGETSANIGLDLVYRDKGVGARTGNPSQFGMFKIPSLRNLELTGPYMHDGRYATLEQVVRFYSDSIQAHPNLDEDLKNEMGNPIKLNLSDDEVSAMVAFLNSLTDYNFIQDPKFSNPFQE